MNSGVWVSVVIYAFGGGGFFFLIGGGGRGGEMVFFSGGREGNQLLPRSIKGEHRKLTAY